MFWATTTILATGGTGRMYRETTNPAVATGDETEGPASVEVADAGPGVVLAGFIVLTIRQLETQRLQS